MEIRSYRAVFDLERRIYRHRPAALEPRRCAGARDRLLPRAARHGRLVRAGAAAAARWPAHCPGISSTSRCRAPARRCSASSRSTGAPRILPRRRCLRHRLTPRHSVGLRAGRCGWGARARRALAPAGDPPAARRLGRARCGACATPVPGPSLVERRARAAGVPRAGPRRSALAAERARAPARPRPRRRSGDRAPAKARLSTVEPVRAPIACVYGNCVFAEGLDDCWAAFVVGLASYQWLSEDGKRARLLELLGAIEAVEADLQIVRVARRWELARYVRELREVSALSAHATCERERISPNTSVACATSARRRAKVFLLVSLRDPERDVAAYVSQAAESGPREWWREIRRAFSPHDRRLLKASELERARVRADQAHARLADYLPVRQARGVELQWLIRRAFCRGLGEPQIDGLHEPRALVFERNGEAQLAPLEGDVLRWMDSLRRAPGSAAADRVRARDELAGTARARRAARARHLPRSARRVDVRARREPALPDRPLAERALPRQRPGAADRAPAHPGRRSDRQGRVRRRSGGLRPRLSAHAGGPRPARLPAGLESPAAVARDARDRRRGKRRGAVGGARGDGQARLRRDPPAPPARRSAAPVRPAPARGSARAWRATTTR